MKPLTPKMREVLNEVATSRVPESFRKNGFTANPDRCFDGRIVPALYRMGLVDCPIHVWRPRHEDKDRYTVCVQITDAGRATLAEG